MKIKNSLVLFLVLLFFSSILADWQTQNSGVTDNLFAIYFVNDNSGWAVGANGKILFTNNGGASWGQQTSNVTVTLLSLDFPLLISEM
jgi:hypothetical protein